MSEPSLTELAEIYLAARRHAEASAAASDAAKTDLIAALMEADVDAVLLYPEPTLQCKLTLRQGHRPVFDEVGLERALGSRMWARVTKPVLDRKLLEAQVTVGAIAQKTVAEHVEIVPNKPTIALTEHVLEATEPVAEHVQIIQTAPKAQRKKRASG